VHIGRFGESGRPLVVYLDAGCIAQMICIVYARSQFLCIDGSVSFIFVTLHSRGYRFSKVAHELKISTYVTSIVADTILDGESAIAGDLVYTAHPDCILDVEVTSLITWIQSTNTTAHLNQHALEKPPLMTYAPRDTSLVNTTLPTHRSQFLDVRIMQSRRKNYGPNKGSREGTRSVVTLITAYVGKSSECVATKFLMPCLGDASVLSTCDCNQKHSLSAMQ